VNEELISLTLECLFFAPTCDHLMKPFVQTVDSWTAALKYLSTPLTIPLLKNCLSELLTFLSVKHKRSNDFTYAGRHGISNLSLICYVNAQLQVLNVFFFIFLEN
jgi:hypothetical protein